MSKNLGRRFGNKFGNKRTTVDGIAFASKAEATRYQELRLLERIGEVWNITLQAEFPIFVGEDRILVCKYIADFEYFTRRDGVPVRIVEDVKGMKTPMYNLKKKLMLACHGIEIQEIGGNRRRKATKKLANAKPQNRKG